MMRTEYIENNDNALDGVLDDKRLKIVLYIGGGLVAIYVLGIAFKVLSHTVGNFKELNQIIQTK